MVTVFVFLWPVWPPFFYCTRTYYVYILYIPLYVYILMYAQVICLLKWNNFSADHRAEYICDVDVQMCTLKCWCEYTYISVTLHYLSSVSHWSVLPSVLWCCWLVGRKDIRPVKNWVLRCWHGYLSGARCRLAYGPADATATRCLLLQ